jgi:hypothetical protein
MLKAQMIISKIIRILKNIRYFKMAISKKLMFIRKDRKIC